MSESWLLRSLVIGLTSVVTSHALVAQPSPPTGSVTLSNFAFVGDGCPPGSVAYNISSDGLAFTILFSSYFVDTTGASAHPGAHQTIVDTKRCQVHLKLNFPPGWTFALLGVDVRGFANLDAGSIGEHILGFKIASLPDRQFNRLSLRGPYVDD